MSDVEKAIEHNKESYLQTTFLLTASPRKWQASALAADALGCLALVQCINGILATSATLGLYVYISGSTDGGARRLALVSLVRFALLTVVGLVSYEAFTRKSRWFLGLGHSALCRAALYLQLLWFSSELLLGSALIIFLPLVKGSFETANPAWGVAATSVLPICYIVSMAGCLCFISRLTRRRRHDHDSPLSESDSCSSQGTTYLEFTSAPSPVSTLGQGHVTCEVVLVEHQLCGAAESNDGVMFVHKKLRPIKTRPEDYKPILKDFLKPKPSASIAVPVQQQQGGSSGARSITSIARLGV